MIELIIEVKRKMKVRFRFAVSWPRLAVPLPIIPLPRPYVRRQVTVSDTPIPTSRLNMGARHQSKSADLQANTPPIAICGYPWRASEVSATKSPSELPQASTVRPRITGEMFSIRPSALSRLTSSLAIVEIQITDSTKPTRIRTARYKPLGGSSNRVKKMFPRSRSVERISRKAHRGKEPKIGAVKSTAVERKANAYWR